MPSFPSDLLITIEEVMLYGYVGLVQDVAFNVEYYAADDWSIDRIGFVEKYGKYGNHDICWISEGHPLHKLLRDLLTSTYCNYIDERIALDIERDRGCDSDARHTMLVERELQTD